MSGSINGLASIELYSSPANWDADADFDGQSIGVTYKDSDGGWVFWSSATVQIDVNFFISKGIFSLEKKYSLPFFSGWTILRDSGESAQVPLEQYSNNVGAADRRFSSGYGTDVVDSVIEITITLADGSQYSARNSATVVLM